MNNKFKKLLIVFIIFLINQFCAAAISNIIIFGDSLSDVGNNGRYTDEMLWVEVLAEKLGHSKPKPSITGGLNFACSGAMSGNGIDECPDKIMHLEDQITLYLERNENQADPDALYVIWVGGNDFLAEVSSEVLINNIINHLETLINAGARHFFIPNMPSLIHAPRGEEMVQSMVDKYWFLGIKSSTYINNLVCNLISNQVDSIINSHNIKLNEKLSSIESSREDIIIHRLDVYTILNQILSNLESYGLTNKSQLFYDPLHPNSKGHSLIADAAFEKILKSIIQEESTLQEEKGEL